MNWERFKKHYLEIDEIGFAIDISRMRFRDDFFESMVPLVEKANADMQALESGSIANPDEGRMVGHYWLRNPELAPNQQIQNEIEASLLKLKDFAARVHSSEIQGASGIFENLLVIGIGGSALGPQFVSQALGHPNTDKLAVHFFDNTDPDGIATILAQLDGKLGKTLVLVISKSGGTPETRNGMLLAKDAYKKSGLHFGAHAVAITGAGSKLDEFAKGNGWLERFPMWDWVGGRTSETGTVGLIPAILQGLDIEKILKGAREMDVVTRETETAKNPAMLLALMWYHATGGKGEKDMVVLPYKDRLQLFSKYLQQLVMESLGKELDLKGNIVNQGIAVYGNKGSTDQHAYVQQLREGVNNFFVTFIEVLRESQEKQVEVEPNITPGDYLEGFLLGTRQALHENKRDSITITVKEVSPISVGQLIALFERAVGFYASFIGINAYHQPGVEAGKKAAAGVIELNLRIQKCLQAAVGEALTADEIKARLAPEDCTETIYKLLEFLASKPDSPIYKKPSSTFHLSKFLYRA
ncbi:MAG: glucose-6-phosphate isomerase [Opitutae bacterium]|nr:glucose-6-phosphate isomerase [Opitutae bacterium]